MQLGFIIPDKGYSTSTELSPQLINIHGQDVACRWWDISIKRQGLIYSFTSGSTYNPLGHGLRTEEYNLDRTYFQSCLGVGQHSDQKIGQIITMMMETRFQLAKNV